MTNLFSQLQQERAKQHEAVEQENKETRKQGSQIVSQEATQPANQVVSLPPVLVRQPEFYRKQATFEFEAEELDFLEVAKYECRRNYGLNVTKNDIVRAALEMLAKDYQENKETSFLVRKVSGKPAR